MNRLLQFLFIILFAFCTPGDAYREPQPKKGVKCYGYTPCSACKNCNGCQYCHENGGTCGVCADRKERINAEEDKIEKTENKIEKRESKDESYTQCIAITKKGTRCKRRATKGEYCWQHAK